MERSEKETEEELEKDRMRRTCGGDEKERD